MFSKLYDILKKILKDTYKEIIFIIVFTFIMLYPVPYYIITGGGITDLSDRFVLEDSYKNSGTYNLSYVSQANGNVLTFLLSYVFPSWSKEKIEEYKISDNETLLDIEKRDKLSLSMANQSASFVAFTKAGYDFTINDVKFFIIYVDKEINSSEEIKIGDEIEKIDGMNVNSFEEFKNYIKSKNVNDNVTLSIKRDGKEKNIDVKIRESNKNKIVGLSFYKIYDYETKPKITFNFKSGEQGPSAGFMTSLAIYDCLIEEDLTNNLKIAGTGTIDEDGKVGEISGVKEKLHGAESAKADIFFVPSENYEEALKIKNEKNYKIKVIKVSWFDDAVNYLRNIKK